MSVGHVFLPVGKIGVFVLVLQVRRAGGVVVDEWQVS